MDQLLQPLGFSTESHNSNECFLLELQLVQTAGAHLALSHGSLPLHKFLPLSQLPGGCEVHFSVSRAEFVPDIPAGLVASEQLLRLKQK